MAIFTTKKQTGTTTVIFLIAIGLMAGVFGGIFGVGGAIVMIPAMVYFLGVDQHTAQGTSLAVMDSPTCLKIAGFKAEDLRPGIIIAQKDKFFNFTKGRIVTLDY